VNRPTLLAIVLALFVGCKSANYAFWNKLGYEKSDILVSRVEKAKDEQEAAKEQFKTTMQKFQELTNFNGGDLEAEYKKLSSENDSCESRVTAVHKRINDVDSVAQDMFKEWNDELAQYQDPNLRAKSQQQLNDSKARYATLIAVMRQSETKMDPVLKAFHDQVLFLKHNLNAAAISSLQTTTAGIDSDVQSLIKDMENSINEANAFIAQMKK
jgi:hypothetical protein